MLSRDCIVSRETFLDKFRIMGRRNNNVSRETSKYGLINYEYLGTEFVYDVSRETLTCD